MLSKNLKSQIIVKKAETLDELVHVGQVVYDRYLAAGYISPNKFSFWLTHFQLLPEANVFILLDKLENKILTTMSILDGSNVMLPCEFTFKNYVNNLKKNKKVAEILSLANVGIFDLFLVLSYNVFRWCIGKFDLLLIETHPKREAIFKRFSFSICNMAKTHACVNAPVIFMAAGPEEIVKKMEYRYSWLKEFHLLEV